MKSQGEWHEHAKPSAFVTPMPGFVQMQKPKASCSIVSQDPIQRVRSLLMEAAERIRLTARGYHRVLRVARTIADLAGAESVTRSHVAEAIAYRQIAHAG